MPNPEDVFVDPAKYWKFLTESSDDKFEGQHFDRKQAGHRDASGKLVISQAQFSALKTEITETTSAFGNLLAGGGLLVIGISSSGETYGINHLTEEQKNKLTNIGGLLVHHAARVRIYEHSSETLGSVEVCLIYSDATYSGVCETPGNFPKAWIRVGCQNLAIDQEKRDQVRRDKRFVNFESMPCCAYEREDVDDDVLSEFRMHYVAMSGFEDWSDEKLLYQAGAIVKDGKRYRFTNAGLLFFSVNPQRVLPYSLCRLLRFDCDLKDEDGEKGNPSFDRSFSGPITKQIRQLRTFLKESAFFRTFQSRLAKGGFKEDPEFPSIAVDESIVNAIAHRDYAIQFPIELRSYRDAFVVKNSGSVLQREIEVPSEFNLADLALVSTPRNSKIMEWLRLMKDEHGAEFVRALSEGTRRMRDEMRNSDLPAPIFNVSPWQSKLTLLNNLAERRKQFGSDLQSNLEVVNLFPLKVIAVGGGSVDRSDFRALKHDFSSALKDSLEANGWFIDSFRFSRVVAHRQGLDLPMETAVKKILRLYRGYVFQLRDYDHRTFLSIDYSLQVRSVLSSRLLTQEFSWLDQINKTAIAEYQGWRLCKIISCDIEFSKVYFFDFESEEIIPSNKVIPNLDKRTLARILKERKIGFDLDREIKQRSLLFDAQASRTRWDLIQTTAQDVAANVFPLRVRQLKFSLSAEAEVLMPDTGLSSGGLKVRTIQEPKVEFHQHNASTDVRDGITRFGAYDKLSHEIEIVPICLEGSRQDFGRLIERLKTGKYKYKGAERTFNTRFHYASVFTCETASQLESQCQRVISEHPDWIGNSQLNRIFLVQTPEGGNSLDDENSPYYRVKRLLLESGFPCQMVDTDTVQNPDWKDLNLALNLIAKCGVLPWVLPDVIPDADFFIGLSYTQSRKENQRLLGHANVFNNYGRWMFFSGNTQAVPYEEKAEHFHQLVMNTLKQLPLSETPSLYFHSSNKFSKDDRNAILSAARAVCPNAVNHFVWINSHHNLRFFDLRPEADGSLGRGKYVIAGPNQIYLSTTGQNPFRKLMGTPIMLEINAFVEGPHGTNNRSDLHSLASQILSLTKLNWASTDSLCGEPITIKYAGDIAYLTAAFLRQNDSFLLHPVLEKTPWFI